MQKTEKKNAKKFITGYIATIPPHLFTSNDNIVAGIAGTFLFSRLYNAHSSTYKYCRKRYGIDTSEFFALCESSIDAMFDVIDTNPELVDEWFETCGAIGTKHSCLRIMFYLEAMGLLTKRRHTKLPLGTSIKSYMTATMGHYWTTWMDGHGKEFVAACRQHILECPQETKLSWTAVKTAYHLFLPTWWKTCPKATKKQLTVKCEMETPHDTDRENKRLARVERLKQKPEFQESLKRITPEEVKQRIAENETLGEDAARESICLTRWLVKICAQCYVAEDDLKGETRLRRCARCDLVRYCSKECQVAHWNDGHKAQCKKLAQPEAATK